jgi:hypothetical protein
MCDRLPKWKHSDGVLVNAAEFDKSNIRKEATTGT